MILQQIESFSHMRAHKKPRGYNVLSPFELIKIAARDKQGELQTVPINQQWITTDPVICLEIFKRCSPVFGVVTGRANKIASTEWHIVCDNEDETQDKIAHRLKSCKQIFFEQQGVKDWASYGMRLRALQIIQSELPDCRSDLANFDACLFRWLKRMNATVDDKRQEITDFFNQPNPYDSWTTYSKKIVQDMMIHGRAAIYKQRAGDKMGNVYVMPGGTVTPIHGDYVGDFYGFVQMLYSNTAEAQLFFKDEIALTTYMPNSAVQYGMNPIDALLNLVTESLLFEQMAAEMADGQTPPQKMVVFGEKDGGLGMGGAGLDLNDPIDENEQSRIELKMNRKLKDRAIATLTGYGTPMVLDLSKADTFPSQMQRVDQIKKQVGLVYNATNLELNETGGDGTSGRNTSEAQERIENAKGTRPLYMAFEDLHNHQIIPFRFGTGYRIEFASSKSDDEKIAYAKAQKDSGLFSVNEIRVGTFNEDPYDDPQFDVPQGATPAQAAGDALGQIAASMKGK